MSKTNHYLPLHFWRTLAQNANLGTDFTKNRRRKSSFSMPFSSKNAILAAEFGKKLKMLQMRRQMTRRAILVVWAELFRRSRGTRLSRHESGEKVSEGGPKNVIIQSIQSNPDTSDPPIPWPGSSEKCVKF